jgi:hypothetical protein
LHVTGDPVVRLDVVEGDAFAFAADALVLKFAQALYGVDAKAAQMVGLDRSELPPPGGVRLVADPPWLAARTLVFVGVAHLGAFGYSEIRDFARQALSAVARERPDARTVALTMHGPGYGLDEVEAFDAEVAGILDALRTREVPRRLERIVILEVNTRRAERLRSRLDEVLSGSDLVAGAHVADAVVESSARHLERVGYDSAAREHAFVAMPFAEEFEDLFYFGISAAVRSAGLLCERIDETAFTGDVMERVREQIETARLVVADLTGSNPNVFLEVGYAWGRRVPTVLVARKDTPLNFDVRGQRCLFYKNIRDAERLLATELRTLMT